VVPPALETGAQAQLKVAVQASPQESGIDLPNWNWKVVREFIRQRFGIRISRSSCLNYLHRLGFVLKRPKKRFLKADEAKREAFVLQYAELRAQARQRRSAKVFFGDEAHFRADVDLRGKWVLKGQPALVDSTSPRWGEKASYYSAVCLETGEVEDMELEGNSNAQTSTAFLKQLREKHTGPLVVIWDNSPAHHGEALRDYLTTPGLDLCLVNLPGYSPDFNGDEAIWKWGRAEVTANQCLGTKAKVQEKMRKFFETLAHRTSEVKDRCRTVLQERADALPGPTQAHSSDPTLYALPTLALV
jgi:transposase